MRSFSTKNVSLKAGVVVSGGGWVGYCPGTPLILVFDLSRGNEGNGKGK